MRRRSARCVCWAAVREGRSATNPKHLYVRWSVTIRPSKNRHLDERCCVVFPRSRRASSRAPSNNPRNTVMCIDKLATGFSKLSISPLASCRRHAPLGPVPHIERVLTQPSASEAICSIKTGAIHVLLRRRLDAIRATRHAQGPTHPASNWCVPCAMTAREDGHHIRRDA